MKTVTLRSGDVVITGTPAGGGLGMKLSVLLAPGDQIDMRVTALATRHHAVRRS